MRRTLRRMTVKVPLYGSPIRAVQLDERATEGAVFGVNLKWPDGRLVQEDDFSTSAPGGSGAISTTDDLDEGRWNFYFTDRRAQDAVGAILADSANVTLRYVAGASIKADLTELPDAGGGVLQRTAFDAYGRKTGTSAATTDDLPEGNSRYFTDARAYAATKAALKAGSNVALTANDATQTITIAAAGGSGGTGTLHDGGSAASVYTAAQHAFDGGAA